MKSNQLTEFDDEIQNIRMRYEKRKAINGQRYSILAPQTYLLLQELEKKIINIILKFNLTPVNEKKLLEIGCGYGKNLLQFIKLGFEPENLVGNDLLSERVAYSRKILPSSVTLLEGDALNLDDKVGTFDIIYQSMVFSSILNENYQIQLAEKIWSWVRKDGGILWYDFFYNNPINRDVRGIRYARIKKLFPYGRIYKFKVLLTPQIVRQVVKIHPILYQFLNFFPFLRTHWLCWIQK